MKQQKRPADESTPECLGHSHGTANTGESFAPSAKALEKAAALFRAMGDPARLRLLVLLGKGERCVGELVDILEEKFPTVSQRLRLLRVEGLVARRRDGNHLHYALADRHVAELVNNALAHAAELAVLPAPNEDEGD
jgi:ArsR family transcriptional regulator